MSGVIDLRRSVLSMAIVLTCLISARVAVASDSSNARAHFAHPPRQYSTGPLWVWNDMLTEDQIRSTLTDLANQHVKQVWVHPRPGLMTPYLSADWFRLWKVALQVAEELDMNVWIYDENSYPSGFAGGLVPDALPDSRGQGISLRPAKKVPEQSEDVVAVYQKTNSSYQNVTAQWKDGAKLPAGNFLVAARRWAPTGGWFGGKYYVDLLRPGVTQKFLQITMDAYKREIGDQFGKRVPGVFTDEPHLAPAGGLHWSDHLPASFQQRWGYDLMDQLPSLTQPVGDWKRVRHDYYQLLLEQFIDRWARPFYEYCEANNLEFTGHYWEHGWPDAGHGGDNMAMYAWHQRPAIDILMNQYQEDVHAQFGNVRSVLELASAANQLGRNRTLCEAYGAGGWDLRFEDMKRIGDWLYVLGVNTLNQHLSYITIRGARKRDHPQSFSYHTPWFDSYHVLADYFTRLSLVLTEGEQVNSILVLEPTTTSWMLQGTEQLKPLGDRFQSLVTELAKSQVEFDIGCEDIIARHGKTDGNRLVVGERRYAIVVLPEMTDNLNLSTVVLLKQFVSAGGTLLRLGPIPSRVDGIASNACEPLAKAASSRQVSAAELKSLLLKQTDDGLAVRQNADSKGTLFHHRRRLDDGDFLFLTNTSIDAPCAGTIRSNCHSIQEWSLQTGDVAPYAFEKGETGVGATFHLPPCGSLLLFLNKQAESSRQTVTAVTETIPPTKPIVATRVDDNVLTLDYVDVTAKGQTKKNVYFYAASQFVFQQHGLDQNPWDSCVQFHDELITKTFPADSGFEATYRFTIQDKVPPSLSIVIERPDLYTIRCNGQPVTASGDWWLDRAFGRIDIKASARVGENIVTLTAAPFTILHELEPAYVLGNFSLVPADSGFVLSAAESLRVQKDLGWNQQGCPFYAKGVAYEQTFEVEQPHGRYVVSLPDWYGSVARVVVNDKPAGIIAYQPWECDVTPAIGAGKNRVKVVVVGTLKNTLGPHHAGALRGAAWPHMFQQGPQTGPPAGSKYDTIAYGLFEPFVLKNQRNQ